MKCVSDSHEEVADEMQRWERAAAVYVLGAKPPSHIMQGCFERRWNKFGVVNIEDRDLYGSI